MGAILALLLGVLSKLPGMVGDYFKGQQDLQKIQLDTQKQIAIAQQQMASDIAKAEAQTSQERLHSTGSWFKEVVFYIWLAPFVIGLFLPEFSARIFQNLSGMPSWYVQSTVMLVFAVWGVQVSAPIVSNIFTGLGNYISDRRDYKLEKARINRQAVFAELKSKMFPKGLTQTQVDAVDKALDAGEQ